jgi:hypothetical protein
MEKTGAEADSKRIRRSVLDYLEGDQDLGWVAGVLGDGDMDSMRLFVRELEGYGDAGRYERLVRWVEAQP